MTPKGSNIQKCMQTVSLYFSAVCTEKYARFLRHLKELGRIFLCDFFASNVFIRVLRNNYFTFYNIWPFWGQIREGGSNWPPPLLQYFFDRASRTRSVPLPRAGRNGFFLTKIFVLNIWALKSQKKTLSFANFCPGQLFCGGCQIDPPPLLVGFKHVHLLDLLLFFLIFLDLS